MPSSASCAAWTGAARWCRSKLRKSVGLSVGCAAQSASLVCCRLVGEVGRYMYPEASPGRCSGVLYLSSGGAHDPVAPDCETPPEGESHVAFVRLRTKQLLRPTFGSLGDFRRRSPLDEACYQPCCHAAFRQLPRTAAGDAGERRVLWRRRDALHGTCIAARRVRRSGRCARHGRVPSRKGNIKPSVGRASRGARV